jgi:hypothetical protein
VSNPPNERTELWWMMSVLVVFCILCGATARTVLPQPDEALYANPGYNLLYNGYSGTTLYELRGYMPASLGHRTYWQFPLYFFVTPVWFSMVGFGVLQVRAFSILFGLVGLISWYWIVRMLSGSSKAGLLAMTMISIDYFWVLGASTGRMDMLCCGLGAASMAVYLWRRERSLVQALFWGHLCATLSILTHPIGVSYWLGLVSLILRFDRRSLSIKAVVVGLLPALVGVLLYGAFILQDSQAFLDQMRSNLANNSHAFDTPDLSSIKLVRLIQLEWRNRYVGPFGLGPHVGMTQRLKAIILVSYVVAILGGFGFARIQRLGGQALSGLAVIAILYLTLVSPSKFFFYLPHVTAFMAACLGLLLYSFLVKPGGRSRWVAAGIGLLIVGIQLGGILYRIRENSYHRIYLPVVQLIQENSTPESTIMASGELWFALEHNRFVIHDPDLGALSGRKPNVIVWAATEKIIHERARLQDPSRYEHVQQILDTSRLIHQDEYYQVYLPKR